jgi:DNA-binding NarL/FixJ family response regulator
MFDYHQKFNRKYQENFDSVFRKYILDQQELELCQQMKHLGYSYREIAKALHVSEGTIRDMIKKEVNKHGEKNSGL